MQAAVLVLLWGVSLWGVRAQYDQTTPDLLSMVKALQTRVDELEKNQGKHPTVAFYVGYRNDQLTPMYTQMGPLSIDSVIKYMNIVTNIGNGYSAVTGMFTAPVKGLYVFHFTGFTTGIIAPHTLAVPKKSGFPLPATLAASNSDPQAQTTTVSVVALEVGDTVYVELPAGKSVFDGFGAQNSFSGFLISPM